MVRPAAADDLDGVLAVFLASRASLAFLPRLHTDDETRAYLRDVVLVHAEVLVAEDDGHPVGFLARVGDEVEHLYVHPSHIGRGIGSALLAEAAARRRGPLELWCFAANARARRFYERHGFVAVGRTDGDNEEGLPDVRYRRD